MYVDDTTLFDAVGTNQAVKHLTVGTPTKEFREFALRDDFQELSRRAEDIGMRINHIKMQLLVISPRNGYSTGAAMDVNDVEIRSVDRLKLVGFTFGSKPNAHAHVEALGLRFRTKIWMLYNLRKAGFKRRLLFKLYCCYLRSILEYCSVVYHALLTGGQAEALEKMHRHAVRICYRFDENIAEVMQENCIESLMARRERRCDTFIRKSLANPRFGPRWFSSRPPGERVLRRRREILEPRAATLRRFKSPLAFMTRRANELGLSAPADT